MMRGEPERLGGKQTLGGHPAPSASVSHSEIRRLDAGHFPREQAADDYGRLVADWISGGYRRVVAG